MKTIQILIGLVATVVPLILIVKTIIVRGIKDLLK